MKYFIDFEATQFCQRIISIGCVNEQGDSFYTLVKTTGKDKVSNYITKLTGITNQKLREEGVSADQAFKNFFQWICETNNGTLIQYYCYGNCDNLFLENTIKKMKEPIAITFAKRLAASLIDYAEQISAFFKLQDAYSLRKIYTFLNGETFDFQHDALEDAKMLASVVKDFYKLNPEDKKNIDLIKVIRIKPSEKKAPELFVNWPANKMDADTGANETNWQIKAIISGGPHVKYFNSMEVAVMWVVRYLAEGISIKNSDQCKKIEEKIKESIATNKSCYNCVFYERRSD